MKKLVLVIAIIILSVSQVLANVPKRELYYSSYHKLKKAIAIVESDNGLYNYRYEPRIYTRYLKGQKHWERLVKKYGMKNISASHGKYHILYSTAYQYGFRGSPKQLATEAVQEKMFDRIFKILLKKANGNYDKAVMAWNTGSPKVKNKGYLKKVKKHIS